MRATSGEVKQAAASIRDQLAMLFEPLIPAIAGSVARKFPKSFDKEDMEQVGRLAVLDAGPRVEQYLRKRVHGAIVNSMRGRRFREAKHCQLSVVSSHFSVPDPTPAPLDILIDKESVRTSAQAVQMAVQRLPADQARVVQLNYGVAPRRAGRPRIADLAAEREALGALRGMLKAA